MASKNSKKSRRGRRNRRHGAKKELDSVQWFRDQGYIAIHNTHGPFDVMAAKAHPPYVLDAPLIFAECKSGKSRFGNYPPEERAKTIAVALQGGGLAVEIFWKLNAREPELIPASGWPRG